MFDQLGVVYYSRTSSRVRDSSVRESSCMRESSASESSCMRESSVVRERE